jgi:hypothetical protein
MVREPVAGFIVFGSIPRRLVMEDSAVSAITSFE